MKHEQAYSK